VKNTTAAIIASGAGILLTIAFGVALYGQPPEETMPDTLLGEPDPIPRVSNTAEHGNWPANPWLLGSAEPNPLLIEIASPNVKITAADRLAALALHDKLREIAPVNSSPEAARNLIARYQNEHDTNARAMLKAVIAGFQTPEMLAFASRLATSSDPDKRRDGFDLIRGFSSTSASLRMLLQSAILNEQTPAVLSSVIAALPSISETISADDNAILSQLRNLMRHTDPNVRNQSSLMLFFFENIGAPGSTVPRSDRQATVTATSQESTIQADVLKIALLDIACSRNESLLARESAVRALQRIMENDELSRFSAACMRLEKRTGTNGPDPH